MEWEWKPERQNQLGALGLAGICRETSRVVRRAILPNLANLAPPALYLSAILLKTAIQAHFTYDPDLDHASSLLGLVVMEWVMFCTLELKIIVILLFCSLCGTGGDHLATDRVLPDVPFRRLAFTFLLLVFPLFAFSSSLLALAYLPLDIKIALPLRLLGWADAAYVCVVGQLACVVSALEDAALFSAVRRSRELLAGKFWAAACFLVTLDGCIVAVVKAFLALVVDDPLGLGVAFQVAAGVALFVALSAVLVVALVAPPVVYVVCKAHQEPSTATIKLQTAQ